MQRDLDKNIEQEKNLTRRSWQGLGLMLLVGIAIIGSITGLIFGGAQALKGHNEPAQVLPFALVGLVATLVIGIGGLALITYLMRWSMAPDRERFARSTQVLKQTLPNLPVESEVKTWDQVFSVKALVKLVVLLPLYSVAMVLALVGITKGIEYFYPDAPDWLSNAIFFVLFLGGSWLIGRARNKRRAPTPAQTPAQVNPGNEWTLTRAIGGLVLFAYTLLPLFGLIELLAALRLHPVLFAILALVLSTFGVGLLVITALLLPHFWIVRPLHRGDYAGALHRVEWVEKFHPFRGEYLNTHGLILFWAGRYAEAEQLLQESIVQARREVPGSGQAGLENIGCVRSAQGRYEEAIQAFEGSIRMAPTQAAAFVDLASVYLEQGREPQRVLELTERARQNHQASFEARLLNTHTPVTIWGNRAWAFALLGRDQDAEEALHRMFAVTPRDFRPALAGAHYRAGRVRMVQGDRARAAEEFIAAQRVDPDGHYGRLSTRALREF